MRLHCLMQFVLTTALMYWVSLALWSEVMASYGTLKLASTPSMSVFISRELGLSLLSTMSKRSVLNR